MAWPPERFLFIAGRLALDFVHTGGEGARAKWERWHEPKDLADWFAECAHVGARVTVSEGELREARALREAIWTSAYAILADESVPSGAARAISRAAAQPPLVPVLRDGAMAWARGGTGAAALSMVARDAIELFGTDAVARMHKCQNPQCFLLFVDLSRSGKRAWCTMERCGNLNKIARYRAKNA